MRPSMAALARWGAVALAVSACDATDSPPPLVEVPLFHAGGSRTLATAPEQRAFLGYVSTPTPGEAVNLMIIDTLVVSRGTVQSHRAGESGFEQVAARLTDGINNWVRQGFIYLSSGTGASETADESSFLNRGGGTYTTDLQGYTVTRWSLVVDSVSVQSPGSDPNGDGIWTDYWFAARLLIWADST